MRRAAFVKANKDRWKEFDELVSGKKGKPDPDQLADLFIQVQDDLSFSSTHYPGTDTTQYLNLLASKIHLSIYKNKREGSSRFKSYWMKEVPLLFYKYRRHMLYSFLIFTISMAIGAISAANDDMFVRIIMGDEYVDMTLANIEEGDPMAVYSSSGRTDMFFGITLNNVMVSMIVFIWGGAMGKVPLFLTLSFGTGLVLMYNGIMVGSFQYFFHTQNLLLESASTIWIHGTIEIASIIVAGAAGLVSGNAILFPGTYRRRDSFRRGAKDGLKIILGLVPLFILAGFIESFITRLFGMPLILKLLIIGASLAFVLFYFIWYPRKIYKKYESNDTDQL